MNRHYCLFCNAQLSGADKPEHILLNALGGRKRSRRLVCSECNERFGRTIDAQVAQQVEQLRNHLLLPSGDGKPPPKLKAIVAGDLIIDMMGDGRLRAVHKPLETRIGESEFSIHLRVGSLDELAQYLPHAAASVDMTVDQLLERYQSGTAEIGFRPPGIVNFNFEFGGVNFLRSLVKSSLELWATLVGNDQVRGSSFALARSFVVDGGEDFMARVQIDSRPVPIEGLQDRFGPIFNLIYVSSDDAGRVIGHFTLYNLLGWQFVLAEEGGAVNQTAVLASNPLEPRQWSDQTRQVGSLSQAWLSAPAYSDDFSQQTARFEAALRVAHARRLNVAIKQIVEQEFARGRDEGTEEITPEMIAAISDRTARMFLGFESRVQLGPADVLSLLRDAVSADRKPPNA